MNTTELLKNFVLQGDFDQENIDDFLFSTNMSEKQLIRRLFKLLNSFIPDITPNEDYCEYISKIIDLISFVCENSKFNKKEIEINRTRIKKSREALLALSNKYDNFELLKNANRLDEVILDKNIDVKDLMFLIKELIDRKEDINIIKKIININKNSILSNNSELFDYVFYLTMDSIKNDDREKFYYITLLKVLYSSKIDKLKYVTELNKNFDENNIFANEIYMIIHGVKRSLNTEQILDKYDVYENLPYAKLYVPKNSYSDDDILLTIDSVDTFIRDDAISIRKDGNLYVLGIHIADLATKIKPGTPVDTYALNNFECKFLSGGKRTRVFHRGIEDSLSLNEGTYRSVLSLYVIITEDGEVKDYYYIPNDLKIAENLTYAQSDDLINHKGIHEDGKMLYELYKIARALESKNSDRLKYWNIKNLSKNELYRNTKGDTIVRECMILYNSLMANIVKEAKIPFVYRVQDPEYISYLIEQSNIEVNDSTINAIKDIYLESQYSEYPRRHNGLNTDIYTQASAPMRRYPDFYNQQLFHNFYLEDIPMEFDEERHKKLIHYFNQRAEELSLMSAEYNREMKLSRKK